MNRTTYSIGTVLLVSLLLGACQTTNPYTGQQGTREPSYGYTPPQPRYTPPQAPNYGSSYGSPKPPRANPYSF